MVQDKDSIKIKKPFENFQVNFYGLWIVQVRLKALEDNKPSEIEAEKLYFCRGI